MRVRRLLFSFLRFDLRATVVGISAQRAPDGVFADTDRFSMN